MVRHNYKQTWGQGRHPVIAYLALAAANSAEAMIDIAKGLRASVAPEPDLRKRGNRRGYRTRPLPTLIAMANDGDGPPADRHGAEYVTRVWLRSAILFRRTPECLLKAARETGDLAAMEHLLFVDEHALDDSWLRRRFAQMRLRAPTALTARMTNALAGRMTLPKPRVVLARIAAFAIAISREASRRESRAGKPLTCRDMHGAFTAAIRDEPSPTVDAALPANSDAWRKAVEREEPMSARLARAAFSRFLRTKLAP